MIAVTAKAGFLGIQAWNRALFPARFRQGTSLIVKPGIFNLITIRICRRKQIARASVHEELLGVRLLIVNPGTVGLLGVRNTHVGDAVVRQFRQHSAFVGPLHDPFRLVAKKLNFQVLRRTIATLAQTKGGVKDVQEILGHSQPDITAGVYMQPIAECVKQTQDAIYAELTARPKLVAVS